ncbi:MAG TPA: bacterial proteasome activator family protein [Ilumatobacteraceae bacterium]
MSSETSSDMSSEMSDATEPAEIEHGELVNPDDEEPQSETVTAPAKVMRIGSMVKQLLEEVKGADLDEASRERLAEIYERSIVELADALSPDLQQELHMLALPFKDGVPPTIGEIRVAHAQLVGWLEGLFHGIQATLFAQQLAARQQFEQMRGLAQGSEAIDPRLMAAQGGQGDPRLGGGSANDRPGTYL